MQKTLLLLLVIIYGFTSGNNRKTYTDETDSYFLDSTKQYIQILEIDVEISQSPSSKFPQFSTSPVKLPHCANVFLRDSTLNIFRKDFDTATKAVVMVRYGSKYTFSNGGDNVATYFLKGKDEITVPLSFDKSKPFYKISAKTLEIKPVKPTMEQKDKGAVKTSYKVKKKDNNLVEFTITEIHKVKNSGRMAYLLQDDFGCD